MNDPINVVLLACGSFNPITNLHLRMFEIARDSLHKTGQYTVIGGIVSPVSDGYGQVGFGKKNLAPIEHRCAMIRRSLKGIDWIRLDTWESEQPNWQETVKVLRHHQEALTSIDNSNSSDFRFVQKVNLSCHSDHKGSVQLKLLCGADLLESMGRPEEWEDSDIEEIITKFGIVCKTREGYEMEKSIYHSDILYKYQKNIHIVYEWIVNDISSTKIRKALERGESVKYLVQDIVIQYIMEHKLYGAGRNRTQQYNKLSL